MANRKLPSGQLSHLWRRFGRIFHQSFPLISSHLVRRGAALSLSFISDLFYFSKEEGRTVRNEIVEPFVSVRVHICCSRVTEA